MSRPILFTASLLICLCTATYSQDVLYHITNTSVYEFIDELANAQIIEVNTSIKPYSRLQIANWLNEAHQKNERLSKRQRYELDFYLRDFNKELLIDKKSYKKRLDLFYYRDSLFAVSVNPVLGYQIWKNDNDEAFHRWNGAEFFATLGQHLSLYGSLRDNSENRFLSSSNFITQRGAGVYKTGPKSVGGDYSEARGGILYAWKWGNAGIVKDHFVWGSGYNGTNIFSGHNPSLPHIRLHLNPVPWFDFNYVHAFLVSDVMDTTRRYNAGANNRQIMVPKFLAANMFTVTPLKNLKVSIGNSIVYADEFQLGYLVPVYFYKSVDHTNSNTGGNYLGQNSQMYFDISSRQLKYVHLYASVFIDEIDIGNFSNEKEQSNFISAKTGIAISHPIIPNTTFIAEYTRTNPVTYKHFVNTTTFESNGFNLGHYLRDNAEEVYLGVRCRPFRNLHLSASATMAKKGEDYPYTGQGNSGIGLPFMEKVFWKNNSLAFTARYEIINDGFVFAGIESAKISGDSTYVSNFTPKIFHGKTTTLTAGINFGF